MARRWNKNLRHDGDSVTVQLSMAVSSMSWEEVKHRKDNMLQQQKEKKSAKSTLEFTFVTYTLIVN